MNTVIRNFTIRTRMLGAIAMVLALLAWWAALACGACNA